MKKENGKKHVLSITLFIVLLGLTFFLIFKNTSMENIKSVISHVNPLSISAGILCMILCVACEGECTRIICSSLGCRIGRMKAFVYACSDYYFSAITPSSTGGQPAMAYYMSKDGIPLSKSCVALLLTLVEYMGVLVLMGIAAFFCQIGFLMQNWLIVLMFIIGLVMSTLVIAGSLAAMFSKTLVRRLGLWFINLMARIHIIKDARAKTEAFEKQLGEYRRGAEYIKEHPFISIRVFLICFVQRIMLFMVTYCVYKGLGLTGNTMIEILAMQALVMLSVTALPLPGSVGAAEGMFVLIFRGVFTEKFIMPAMMLTRGINFYFCMLFAGAVTLINHMAMLRREKHMSRSEIQIKGDL